MSTLPLFYKSVLPLDRGEHRNWCIKQPQRFEFARCSHLVPALVDEFGPACRHLPIFFLPESLGPVPVFLVGATPGMCDLIGSEGAWIGRYLPAYLRRYPFIIGESQEAGPLMCLDEESDILLRDGCIDFPDGSPLFTQEGSETSLLQDRMNLAVEYAQAAKRTTAFGRCLQDLGLLSNVTIQLQHPAIREIHTLHGVLGIDECALENLVDSGLERLRRDGWLPMIYSHLISLRTLTDFLIPFEHISPDVSVNVENG